MTRATDARWDMLGRMIGALRDAALIVDATEQRIASSNLAAEQLLGAPDSLQDRILVSLLADQRQRAWLTERLDGCLASRATTELNGLALAGTGGKIIVVSSTVIPALDGQPAGWVLLLRAAGPSTDRAVERALGRRMLVVGQLAADLSHKLRNLSTVCRSGIGQLEIDRELPSPAALDTLRSLKEALEQHDALVERFIELCRGQPAASGTFDVGQTVAVVAELLAGTLPASVALQADRAAWPRGLRGRGDPELALQLILGTAIALRRALFHGGTLRLELVEPQRVPSPVGDEAPSERCCIALGVSPTATPTKQVELELDADRELLAPLGARIEVRTDPQGSALEVRLWLHLDTGTGERERAACSGRGERVLLVATDSYAARMMLSALRAGGYAAELLGGSAALQTALRSARADLVIIDDSACAATQCLPLLAADQRVLLIVDQEPGCGAGPAETMTVCRPFSLGDIGAWVARLLDGASAP